MVAAKGNIYYGQWHPVVVALVEAVFSYPFIRDPKDADLAA